MQISDIQAIVLDSNTVREALLKIVNEIGDPELQFLFYGFMVHLHGRNRNDSLLSSTFPNDQMETAFLAAGGTSTDIVANRLEHIEGPFPIDIVGLAEAMRTTSDPRLKFVETILKHGVKTTWICTINAPWIGGYGVFNLFHRERFAQPAIPAEQIEAFAEEFHEKAKRHGLVAKEIGLSEAQTEFLSQIAMGKSADDLADKHKISSRAVEKRLETIRKKTSCA